MIKVGITGGIGAGKSLIANLFSVLNIPVYNADDRAKYLITTNLDLIHQIKSAFGSEAYKDGQYNRVWMANKVFSEPKKLAELNALIHPAVARDFEDWIKQEENARASYVLKEAALLIESGSYRQLDKLIVVTAPENLRIERIKKRDPERSKEQIMAIISKQDPEKKKVNLADYVINNDGKTLIIPQVLKIHSSLLKETA